MPVSGLYVIDYLVQRANQRGTATTHKVNLVFRLE